MELINVSDLLKLISSGKFSLEDEKVTQSDINSFLTSKGVEFKKEHYLDDRNIIDFYFPAFRTGIEIKIGGFTKRQMFKQLERYTRFDAIESVILLTNKSVMLPLTINQKKSYALNLGKAWF